MPDISELKKKIENAEPMDKLELRMDLAYQVRISDPQTSTEQAQLVYGEACRLQDTELELRALHSICTSHHYNETITDKKDWIDLLISRGMELENNLAVGRAYIHHYRWAMKAGQLVEAAQYLHKALEFFDPEKHPQDISSCYTGLGNINFKLNNYDKAFDYYNLALSFMKDPARSYDFNIRQNIGNIHLIRKEYYKAWEVYQEILTNLPPTETGTRILLLENLGHICRMTNQHQEALDYFKQALELKLHAETKFSEILTLCNLAYVYLDLLDLPNALKNLKQAEVIVSKNDDLNDKIEVYRAILTYHKKNNDLQNQVLFYEKLLDTIEALHNAENLNKINEFEAQHQINLYKERNRILEQNNQVLIKQITGQKVTIDNLICKKNQLESKLNN
jgi:tetratricopeptide (TPR) repeat protein